MLGVVARVNSSPTAPGSSTPGHALGHPVDADGPAHLVLMGLVARQHYLEGRSKVDIAKDLGLSRFKVARLIDEALARGIVRIEIAEDVDLDIDLSVRLRKELNLDHALVLSPGAGDDVDRLGSVAARLLAEILTDTDVLGLPWSRTVSAMAGHVRALPPIPVVQLCGSLAPDGDGVQAGQDRTPVELVVQVARRAGTVGHVFFTPLLVNDADTAQALRREPQVLQALARADDVTTAVVGVGAWSPGLSTIYDACRPDEREEVRDAGGIGEIAGIFFDRDGATVPAPLSGRIMTVDAEQLRHIPQTIALVSGPARAGALEAAAWGGLVSGVVCDSALATRAMELREARAASRAPDATPRPA